MDSVVLAIGIGASVRPRIAGLGRGAVRPAQNQPGAGRNTPTIRGARRPVRAMGRCNGRLVSVINKRPEANRQGDPLTDQKRGLFFNQRQQDAVGLCAAATWPRYGVHNCVHGYRSWPMPVWPSRRLLRWTCLYPSRQRFSSCFHSSRSRRPPNTVFPFPGMGLLRAG
jgi:hypothetical protein